MLNQKDLRIIHVFAQTIPKMSELDKEKGSSNFMVDSPKSILFLLLPKCPQTQTRSP